MFTRDRSRTDPVRFSDRIGLLFTRDRFGTGPERIQNWTCCFAGPVSDPIRTGSRKVPCKHLDRFQTVPCKQKPIRSGSVRNGSGPVPCKRSLSKQSHVAVVVLVRDLTCLFCIIKRSHVPLVLLVRNCSIIKRSHVPAAVLVSDLM